MKERFGFTNDDCHGSKFKQQLIDVLSIEEIKTELTILTNNKCKFLKKNEATLKDELKKAVRSYVSKVNKEQRKKSSFVTPTSSPVKIEKKTDSSKSSKCLDSDGGNESDDLEIDMSIFKKDMKKSNAMRVDVKVTPIFKDTCGNKSMFLIMKWYFWAIKTNALNNLISTLFKSSKDDWKSMYDGSWSVKERVDSHSVVSVTKEIKNYPCYVSLFKLQINGMDRALVTQRFLSRVFKFMKQDQFKECYIYCVNEQFPGSKIVESLQKPDNKMWGKCKGIDTDPEFDITLDNLIIDDDICMVFHEATEIHVMQSILTSSVDAQKVMFKYPSKKKL